MAPGLPDRVDVARLADDAAALERNYPLAEMARLRDLLADNRGEARASFRFKKVPGGRFGATVGIEASPVLTCQRCLGEFEYPVAATSEIEFAEASGASIEDSEREAYEMRGGLVSLRELAEEELLLAMPFAPACATPQTCGSVPRDEVDAGRSAAVSAAAQPAEERTRPFAGLQDMLKKTR